MCHESHEQNILIDQRWICDTTTSVITKQVSQQKCQKVVIKMRYLCALKLTF